MNISFVFMYMSDETPYWTCEEGGMMQIDTRIYT